MEIIKEKIIFSEKPEIINLEELNPNVKRYKCFMCYEGEANRFVFSKEVLNKMIPTILGQPVLTYYFDDLDKFGGHEDDKVSKNGVTKRTPKPYGIGFADYTTMPKWEMYNGKEYLTTTTYLWTHRFNDELENLDEKIKNKEVYQSMEVEIDYYMSNGKKIVTDANCIGLVMIGITPAFNGSTFERFTLDENIIKDINTFKNEYEVMLMQKEGFINKDLLGTENAIQIDKSKDSMSDNTWGDEDKSTLKKDCLKAKNYKTLCKSVFLKLEEGWEDGKEGSLGYPVMEKIGDKVVYNRGALGSAKAYATKNNETMVLTSLKKIYKHLGLEWELKSTDNEKEGEKKDMGKIEFSLNSRQITQILENSLACCKYMCSWGECQKYWIKAYDETYVYVHDYEDGMCHRMEYTLNDDNTATVNLESKQCVIDGGFELAGESNEPKPEESDMDDMDDMEMMAKKMKDMEDKVKTMEEYMAKKDKEMEDKDMMMSKKDEEIQANMTKISSLETGLMDAKNAMEENAKKLKEYDEMFKKQEEEKKIKNMSEIISRQEFNIFSDEEKQEIISQSLEMSEQAFEDKLYLTFGKRVKDSIQFTKNVDETKPKVSFMFETSNFSKKKKDEEDIYAEFRKNKNN